VPSFDGEQIPVFVHRPADGGDGSAVLVIHGGPEWQSGLTWNPIIAGLVDQGHTVVVPNVRGSTGYGKRWYSLDDKHLRLDSVKDLAAIHAWLPSIGIDQSRVALWGGSYGGYMVLAGLAFQPSLWAAGVDIVGMASLVTFLENTSSYRVVAREREYGVLAEDRDFLEEASPLNRVADIQAPLFVIHGANDPRVPLSEAEQIAKALAERDVPCQLLVYPDEGHGLAKRKNKLDAYPQAFAFLREHLASEAAAATG
jgi:dipeptidyl aminopeptidase/acylaminoacyl peptidase